MTDISDIKHRLDQLAIQAEKVKLLDEQAAILTEEQEAARKKVRVAYRDLYANKFADFDYKAALVGAPVSHTIKVGVATFRLSPPSAGRQRAVDAFAATLAAAAGDKPKTPALVSTEGILLSWLVGVALEGQPERKLADVALEVRLDQMRAFPDVTLMKIATECQTLESWLSAQLEIELGN